MSLNALQPDQPGAAKLFLTFSGHPSFKAPIKHNEISYKHLGVVQLSEVLEDAICRQDVKELKKRKAGWCQAALYQFLHGPVAC